MTRGTLIVFLKAPRAGRVKTRLARDVGAGRAAAIFRHLTTMTLSAAEECRAQAVLAIDPPADLRCWRALWPQRLRRIAQGRGDLGARLHAAIEWAPAGPVVVIGADAPELRARHLRKAFRALGRNDAVFGPAADGGYWLIGLARRRRAPRLFKGVNWSTATALADTVASLPKDFKIERLETLRDIDDADDLAAAGPLIRAGACGRAF